MLLYLLGFEAACIPKFQWAPTLGGECYFAIARPRLLRENQFQWAPTLGGECYMKQPPIVQEILQFQWAPTLGGECYLGKLPRPVPCSPGFNGHPPLGVNATESTVLRTRAVP